MRLRRPDHVTVVAYLALFIAVAGGTAMAAKKITAKKLAKNAVTTKKIANGAVTTGKLENDAVTGAKLANGAVGENQIDADAVTANKLAPNSVGTNKIRDEAVESAKLGAGAVTEGKIGNDAVVGSKVAPGSLDLTDYARAVVDTSADPPLLGSGDCAGVDVAVAGVTSGDLVAVYNVSPSPTQVQAVGASSPGAAPGTVAVLFCNAGAGVDAPATPIRIALLR